MLFASLQCQRKPIVTLFVLSSPYDATGDLPDVLLISGYVWNMIESRLIVRLRLFKN